MSEPAIKVDIPAWVRSARVDSLTYRQRQTTEIILHAISATSPWNNTLYLKGGVLMALPMTAPSDQ